MIELFFVIDKPSARILKTRYKEFHALNDNIKKYVFQLNKQQAGVVIWNSQVVIISAPPLDFDSLMFINGITEILKQATDTCELWKIKEKTSSYIKHIPC